MFTAQVDRKSLGERLDAGFYHPEYLLLDDHLASRGAVQLHTVVDGVSCGPFGGNAIADDLYAEEGVFFIRPLNITSNIFDESSLVKVPKQLLLDNRLKIYSGKNLYFGRVGVPCVAIIDAETSISPNIIIARLDESLADPEYLYAFSSSVYGLTQLKRQLKEVAQPTTSTEAVNNLKVFLPDVKSQKYIGDKVRQAERLRAWAKKVEADITVFHQQLIPDQSKLDFSRKTRFVGFVRMTERFDAHFYPGVVEDYLSLKNCGFKPLGELASTVFNGQTQDETEGAGAVEQITVANLSRTYINGQPRRVIKPSNSSKLTKKHDLLICNAAHNKSYIGRDVTYYHSEKSVLPSTEVMVIRVDRELLPASFVRSYLLTQLGFVQIQSTIRGITAHSYPVDMKRLEIPIPSVPDSLKHDWFACDDRMVLAGQACEVATRLISTTKFLVEALIEGLVTEQQLICAQQALDADDNSLEREILGRLTTKGLDGDGEPLFVDLDQLYDLLAQCQQMDE